MAENKIDLKTRWESLASRLVPVGSQLFSTASVTVTDQGSGDIRVLALMLLSRTLSNIRAVLSLIDSGYIVEAKTISRCVYENSYWIGALVREGDAFRKAMVHHEMKHKRMRAKTIFETAEEFRGTETAKKLQQWMREHKEYEASPTLDPKAVASRAKDQSYMFYQQLSWDAHPSIQTLNRYYVTPDQDGVPGIDAMPSVSEDETVETLNLMCLAAIGVLLGVRDLVGSQARIEDVAQEYQELTNLTGRAAEASGE